MQPELHPAMVDDCRYTENVMIQPFQKIPAERIKLAIFDLDGTLVDSQLDLAHSINAMLRHFQRPELPLDVIASYIGDGAPMLVRRALGDPDDEGFVQSALKHFLDYYREHKLDNTFIYPGVLEVLQTFRNAGLPMAVLSNKPVVPSRGICDGLKLTEYFVRVYGGNSFETKKPDPLGARKLLEETGTAPDEAVMIGDSQNDVLTARNAGMWSVGVNYGFSPESLKKHPPDVLVDTTYEIPTALGYPREQRESQQIPSTEGFAS